MKTKQEKETSVMQQLRDIREKISADIKGMTTEELKEYLEKQETLHQTLIWRKRC